MVLSVLAAPELGARVEGEHGTDSAQVIASCMPSLLSVVFCWATGGSARNPRHPVRAQHCQSGSVPPLVCRSAVRLTSGQGQGRHNQAAAGKAGGHCPRAPSSQQPEEAGQAFPGCPVVKALQLVAVPSEFMQERSI